MQQQQPDLVKISLSKALSQSPYLTNKHSIIETFFLDNYSRSENIIIYQQKKPEKILIIKYFCELELSINNTKKNFCMLVYLPSKFPEGEPEFYIESPQKNIKISSNFPSDKINKNTLLIHHNKYLQYNSTSINIDQIVSCIMGDFLDNFPIENDNINNNSNVNINNFLNNGKCCLDYKNLDQIVFNTNEETFTQQLRQELSYKIISSYNKTSQEIKSTITELQKIENELDRKQSEISESNSTYQENLTLVDDLEKVRNDMADVANNIVLNCNDIDINYAGKKGFMLEKCKEVVIIKDEKIYKYQVMEKCIEDFLIYLKKALDKGKISFEVGKNQTRELSKELFQIIYLKKMLKHRGVAK